MSHYQSFAVIWHINRGDTASAQIVASLPPECFAEFDRMLETAVAFGMAMKGRE